VRSRLEKRADAPRQGDEGAPDAFVVFEPEMLAALEGIEAGDELMLLTWLDLADRSVLRVHPRDDLSQPKQGVFATRSSDRPNPIGLHRVRVLARAVNVLHVNKLEAIDGTPVVDVKPVLRDDRDAR
jgi:tRNA-Thr(GGU) m(6)t(6)A37 methyltransferase TsaA